MEEETEHSQSAAVLKKSEYSLFAPDPLERVRRWMANVCYVATLKMLLISFSPVHLLTGLERYSLDVWLWLVPGQLPAIFCYLTFFVGPAVQDKLRAFRGALLGPMDYS